MPSPSPRPVGDGRRKPCSTGLYELLLPHRSQLAIDGIGASCYGSVERHLGILAAILGRPEQAAGHFEAALAANRAAGAPLLVAHTLRDAGWFLGRRERLSAALGLYQELGVEYRAAEAQARLAELPSAPSLVATAATPAAPPMSTTTTGPPSGAVFRKEGDFWTLAWEDTTVRVKDAKGLHDLARLLARPGQEVHVLDLAGAPPPGPAAAGRAAAEGLGTAGHAGELLDERARAEYRKRLGELEEELDEAEAAGDPERSSRARAERDFLVDELSAALGLGGRARRAGDPAERARSTVTQRVRDTLARIERAHPSLGRHLRRSVRTGTFCAYDPAEPVAWELSKPVPDPGRLTT